MIRPLLALAFLQACAPTATPEAASPSGIGISTKRLSFLYSYPPEAAAIPELAALLHKDGTERLAEARQDSAGRGRGSRSGPDKFEQIWEVAADTPDLLAFTSTVSTYRDGSPHGQYAYRALIWHRMTKRRLRLDELFVDKRFGSGDLMSELCKELRRVRAAQRRIEPMPCPGADSTAVVPVAERTKRIKSFRMLLTGDETPEGYAGGSQEIEVSVSQIVAKAIDPALRGSFYIAP